MASKKTASDDSTQVNIRCNRAEAEMLRLLISEANARARSANVPDEITAGSLIRMWIREKAYEASLVPMDDALPVRTPVTSADRPVRTPVTRKTGFEKARDGFGLDAEGDGGTKKGRRP